MYCDFVNILKPDSLHDGIQVWYLIIVFFGDSEVSSVAESFHVSGTLNKLDDSTGDAWFAI